MKEGIRSWLNIREANPLKIDIIETFDYKTNAVKNRLWYRGDGNELQQFYYQAKRGTDTYMFWSCKSSPGMEIRKIHTGIPGIIVNTLSNVVLADLYDIKFTDEKKNKDVWQQITKENSFTKLMDESLKTALYIGDGAFKISFDEYESEYPIIEFYPGDQVEYNINRGRIKEIIFKTPYYHKGQWYILHEIYGYGYIKNRLMKDDKEIDLHYLPQTENISDYVFSTYEEDQDGKPIKKGEYMMAVPLMIFKSSKYEGRGESIFDRKVEAFDSLDESWSQWMDALRAGRTKEYIPDSLLPRNPNSGEVMLPNPFDARYIRTDTDMREGVTNKITLEQPAIPHESYAATYITALDLCLQGLISPSTLGIDVKKLDNAEAQREKEKATLYTRNTIVDALTDDLKQLVETSLKAYYEFHKKTAPNKIEAEVSFGEYANPSFESQVETVGKAKTYGIISTEASVEELYGDSKDEEWKKKEVQRIKTEQGIVEVEEPALNTEGVNIIE